MRRQSNWILGVGCAALLATLVLSVPGVQVVRADENVAEVAAVIADTGPSCEASSIPVQPAIRVELPRIAAAQGDSEPAPFALNNRGYNYNAVVRRPAAHPDNR